MMGVTVIQSAPSEATRGNYNRFHADQDVKRKTIT